MKYKKIDLYTKSKLPNFPNWVYECSTSRSRTCKEAKDKFCKLHMLDSTQVKAAFAEVKN